MGKTGPLCWRNIALCERCLFTQILIFIYLSHYITIAYLQKKEWGEKNSHKDNLLKSRMTPYKNKSPHKYHKNYYNLTKSCNIYNFVIYRASMFQNYATRSQTTMLDMVIEKPSMWKLCACERHETTSSDNWYRTDCSGNQSSAVELLWTDCLS